MTDHPEGPTERVDPDLDDQDVAFAHLRGVIDNWCMMEQLNGTAPLVAAAKLIQVLVDVLLVSMGRGAVRMALLMVFEKTHEGPMSFIERNEAKQMLDQLSNARRQVEGKPHLILPPGGGDDAA